ncbi:DoxX family protein [Sphingobacterium bovistauri]|uniref:DoxX family protein n=1 Tax=Sphingobacterium bovistauri TaxID=2781959 RepID=A0ABS7ZB23_9SPHI|nr:DoxX family protein [Sphingobacterium bovistauri]MCA5006129.1 DoxX family protein [Sphingobacterium bovistauri]
MNTTLWIVQGLLALIFAMAGIMKSTQPIDKLLKSGVTWTDRFPLTTVRIIGLSELIGALGLILPWLLNIFPVLTPIAATSLALVMTLAMMHHLKYKEYKAIAFNFILLVLICFVAYNRFNSL